MPQPKQVEYRGVKIIQNFTSIHGTMRPLKSSKGWNILGYYGAQWATSLEDAKREIDYLHINGNPKVVAFLKRAEEQAAHA